MMKRHLSNLLRFMLLAWLVAIPAHGLQTVETEGQIIAVNNRTLNLSDSQYNLLATTKVTLLQNRKGAISDLKPGDLVRITLIRIDKKLVVDRIEQITGLLDNESSAEDR